MTAATVTGSAISVASKTARSPRRISILGATGSVGESTLDLIARDAGAYEVIALTAGANAARLAEHAKTLRPEVAVVADESAYGDLKRHLAGTGIEAAAGEAALCEAAARPADWIMAAIVGSAGLRPTFAALAQGTHVALANKECLVSAGEVFMQAAARAGATLLPVDSEHCAAFQVLTGAQPEDIEKLVLTASGGPFRQASADELARVTPEQALKHPNWSMGRKITIDSATLMNKGLELIEAHHLFAVPPERLGVLVHPQSIVHCLVHFADGSVLAQMACPDMRTPIAYALAWPERMAAPTERLDLAKIGSLTFEPPDEARFPALGIARQALAAGGTATTVLNAANEVAVEAFLARRIAFGAIADLVRLTLEAAARDKTIAPPESVDHVLEIDRAARVLAAAGLERFC